MNRTDERDADRRRMILLAPLIIAANAFLFGCIAVLGLMALNGGESLGLIPGTADADQQAVRDFLTQTVPTERFRIRQWLPPETPAERVADRAASPSEKVTEQERPQRVQLVFYGTGGAKQIETVYWVRNGHVTRVTQPDPRWPAQPM